MIYRLLYVKISVQPVHQVANATFMCKELTVWILCAERLRLHNREIAFWSGPLLCVSVLHNRLLCLAFALGPWNSAHWLSLCSAMRQQ